MTRVKKAYAFDRMFAVIIFIVIISLLLMLAVNIIRRISMPWIRVEKEEDIQAALDEARTYTDAPTIIEFMISTDEIVLPMVKSGNPMSEMILK